MNGTVIKIYPETWADLTSEEAGKPYQPSNGTEGMCFVDSWCGNCARDKAMSEGKPIEDCDDDEKCDIIANSMAYDRDDPRYPKAWVYGKDGHPCCTAFVEKGKPIPPSPDTQTIDMFEGAQSAEGGSDE